MPTRGIRMTTSKKLIAKPGKIIQIVAMPGFDYGSHKSCPLLYALDENGTIFSTNEYEDRNNSNWRRMMGIPEDLS